MQCGSRFVAVGADHLRDLVSFPFLGIASEHAAHMPQNHAKKIKCYRDFERACSKIVGQEYYRL